MIIQGSFDNLVSPRVTSAFVQASCRNGARVQYVVLPGKGHGSSAKASVKQAIGWINARFNGSAAPSSCR